jgi:signal transduction histidine kinase
MRLRPRYLTVLAADLAAGVTTLVLVLPFLHFAYRSAALHATIETASGMIALLAGYLIFGRYRRSARREDLALATALGFLACAHLVFSAMPWALLSPESMRFSAWTSLVGTVIGASFLAAASVMPSRRLRRPRSTGRVVLAASAATYGFCAILIGVFLPHLPLGFAPTTSPPPPGLPHPVGAHSLLAVQLVGAMLFGVAAVGFTRIAEQTGDKLMQWLAASAALAAFVRVNYSLFPSLYTQWVYIGDALRVGAYLLLLAGVAGEINRYQRSVAVAAAADERRRIARELHDGLAQELAFVATQARELERNRDGVELKYIVAAAERALDESRRAIVLLTHPEDEPLDVALIQTVEELVTRVGGRTRFDVEPGIDVAPETREALLRIVREAVTNASRHGHADVVTVELQNKRGLRLRVADDGVGFDQAAVADGHGLGLVTMRTRAREIGGELRIAPLPEGGTEVEVVIP